LVIRGSAARAARWPWVVSGARRSANESAFDVAARRAERLNCRIEARRFACARSKIAAPRRGCDCLTEWRENSDKRRAIA
jgi:hypothetical protein